MSKSEVQPESEPVLQAEQKQKSKPQAIESAVQGLAVQTMPRTTSDSKAVSTNAPSAPFFISAENTQDAIQSPQKSSDLNKVLLTALCILLPLLFLLLCFKHRKAKLTITAPITPPNQTGPNTGADVINIPDKNTNKAEPRGGSPWTLVQPSIDLSGRAYQGGDNLSLDPIFADEPMSTTAAAFDPVFDE